MKQVLEIIGRALWFLLRLIIYALTDHWIGSEEERPQLPSAPGAPRPQRAAPARPVSVSTDEAARASRWLDTVVARAEALREPARTAPGGRALRAALDTSVLPDLAQARADVRAGRVDARTLEAVSGLDAAVALVSASLEARRDHELARALADAEAIAASLTEPLYEYARAEGLALRPRVFIGVAALDVRSAHLIASYTSIFPVVVPPAEIDRPERLVPLTRSVARRIVDDVPAWVDGHRSALRLAPKLFVPPAGGTYDPDMARAALGVLWPELLADVLAVLWLGPAYAQTMARVLSRPLAPLDTRLAALAGRWLSPSPPLVLRVYAMARTLSRLGFERQANDLLASYARANPAPDVILLPRADGSAVPVPGDFMRSELDALLRLALDAPDPALADEVLTEITGLAFFHGEDAEARDAAAAFTRGQAKAYSPRVLTAAALMANAVRDEQRARVMDALARSVRGAGTLEAREQPAQSVPSAAPPPKRSLAALARDKRAVREAMLLTAVFAPRGGRMRR